MMRHSGSPQHCLQLKNGAFQATPASLALPPSHPGCPCTSHCRGPLAPLREAGPSRAPSAGCPSLRTCEENRAWKTVTWVPPDKPGGVICTQQVIRGVVNQLCKPQDKLLPAAVLRPCWAVKAMLPHLPWCACVIILATPVCSAELPNHALITHKPTDFV